MSSFVVDTMAIVLYLEQRRLSSTVKILFEQTEQNQVNIFIPAMVLAEVLYLSEKGRIFIGINDIKQLIANYSHFQICSLDFSIIEATYKINDIKELHDRVIAATAFHLDVPLITNDPIIAQSQFVETIW